MGRRGGHLACEFFLVAFLSFSLLVSAEAAKPTKIAVEFHDSAYAAAFARDHGLVYHGPHPTLKDIHLYSRDEITPVHKRALFNNLASVTHPTEKRHNMYGVKWFEEQIPKKREKRGFVVRDPKYAEQWHLHGPHRHLNVEPAWNLGYTGRGVRIAIVDDGLEVDHPDIKPNLRLDSSYNFNANISSPNPRFPRGPAGDWHGTASGGAAAAAADGQMCGVGVAPEAELAGIAILQNNADVDDYIESLALAYAKDKNHIYSNSWGPIRPGAAGHMNEAPGSLATKAMIDAIYNGRDGKGSVYVWAAGNDGGANDNCNYDGYANMRYVILIGASELSGKPGTYSEPCAALFALAPGGSVGVNKIVTTDLLGSNGLNTQGDCTSYAGTSAACPQAAGVIALVLQANPNLSWLDLQYVLANATTKLDDDDDKRWRQNAAGKWVSEHYGFGILNAESAVEVARAWGDFRLTEKSFSHSSKEVGVGPETVTLDTSIIRLSATEDLLLHHVEVWLWTSHRNVADTTVKFISPSGTESILATPHGDSLSKWDGWRFLSRMHHGETSAGTWTLNVSSKDRDAKIIEWKLTVYGIDKNTQLPLDKALNVSTPESTPRAPEAIPPPPDPETFAPTSSIPFPTDTLIVAVVVVAVVIGAAYYLINRFYLNRQPATISV